MGKSNVNHLIKALQEMYTISTDWSGTLYCGLSIKWNYCERHVDISMPRYSAAALTHFQHDRQP
jgi:hypothetical protein